MRTSITLNIGLSLPPVEIHSAIAEIQRAGITILASGIVSGEWNGKPEQTLVVQGLALESPELRPRLYCASRALNQDCIAVFSNGLGELIGDTAQVFNAEYFHFHAREERELTARISLLGDDEITAEISVSSVGIKTLQRLSNAFKETKNFSGPYTPSFFVAIEGEDVDSREEREVNGFTLESFKSYLRDTIIPDSRESGFDGYAEDLETALEFLESDSYIKSIKSNRE